MISYLATGRPASSLSTGIIVLLSANAVSPASRTSNEMKRTKNIVDVIEAPVAS